MDAQPPPPSSEAQYYSSVFSSDSHPAMYPSSGFSQGPAGYSNTWGTVGGPHATHLSAGPPAGGLYSGTGNLLRPHEGDSRLLGQQDMFASSLGRVHVPDSRAPLSGFMAPVAGDPSSLLPSNGYPPQRPREYQDHLTGAMDPMTAGIEKLLLGSDSSDTMPSFHMSEHQSMSNHGLPMHAYANGGMQSKPHAPGGFMPMPHQLRPDYPISRSFSGHSGSDGYPRDYSGFETYADPREHASRGRMSHQRVEAPRGPPGRGPMLFDRGYGPSPRAFAEYEDPEYMQRGPMQPPSMQPMAPEDEMAMSALAVAATFAPEAVVDFRCQQLDLMRKLLLRRLCQLTRKVEHSKLTQQNIRVALHVFGLPLIVYDLISRPLRGTAVPGAFPSRRQLADFMASGPVNQPGAGPRAAAGSTPIDLIPYGEEQDISVLVDSESDGSGILEHLPTDSCESSPARSALGDLSAPRGVLTKGDSLGSKTSEISTHSAPRDKGHADVDVSLRFSEPNGTPLPEEALGWLPAEFSLRDWFRGTASSDPRSSPVAGSAPAAATAESAKQHETDSPVKIEPAWERSLAVAVIGALTADLIARKRFRTKLCHSWMRTGSCPRGNGCDYAHGVHELRSSSESRDSRYRTRLCRTWMSTCGSYCPHGDKCAFAHGVHQLRVRLPDADEELQQLLANAQSAAEALGPQAMPGSYASASTSGSLEFFEGQTYGGPEMSTNVTNGGASPVPQGLRKFKGSMCRSWLQGATEGALIAGIKLVSDKSEDVSSLRFDAARAGARRCPRGDACPHAHGLAELRLPAVMEQVRLVEALACEGPYARPGLSGEEGSDGSVPLRDLTLILIASGLLTTNLPTGLVPRVAAVSALLGPNAHFPAAGVFPDFEGLPPAFARALSASVVNPMLQVVLPYTSTDRNNGSRKIDGMDFPPGHRVGLAKIISAVGNESADTAVLAGAVGMAGVLFSLPLHMMSESDAEQDKHGLGSAATGRYGVLLRRRLEIQAALQDLIRLKNAAGRPVPKVGVSHGFFGGPAGRAWPQYAPGPPGPVPPHRGSPHAPPDAHSRHPVHHGRPW